MFCMLKKKIYILVMFQNIFRKEQVIVLMILNEEGWYYLPVKKLRRIT